MATSPAVLVMTQAISLGLAFLRRIAAPEFSRGFQPTERLENIPSSRERRLNSIVADATWNEKRAHRMLMVFENIMQPSFPGRGSDRVSLARLFKAGTISASVRESRQRRLILQIGFNRR